MLNYAAALTRNSLGSLPKAIIRPVGITAACLGAVALCASSATALDTIDLSAPPAPPVAGECSPLVQIKYPFLECTNGQIGQSAENETWSNARHLPMQSDWTEGDAYWGPTLNPVEAAE